MHLLEHNQNLTQTQPGQYDEQSESFVLSVSPTRRGQKTKRRQKQLTCAPPATSVLTRGQAANEDLIEVQTSKLDEFIALELSLVDHVECVFSAFRNNLFYVWIVVNSFEEQVRNSIYDRQTVIIDEFPMFEFDFYLIAKEPGQNVRDLISESVNVAYQRRK